MRVNRNGNAQLRALAIAFAGAIFVAVAAMFMPIYWLETVTGSTGISEIFPSTAAPLGDTARAMLAFAAGVLALAALAYALLRRANGDAHRTAPKVNPAASARVTDQIAETAPVEQNAPIAAETPKAEAESLFTKMRVKVESLLKRDGDGVRDLADLPKLRAGDAHPDAPPRRPISAHRDFGPIFPEVDEVALPQGKAPFVPVNPVTEQVATSVVESPTIETQTVEAVSATETEFETYEPAAADAPLEEVVSSLEQALARRQEQLARLQDIAARMTEAKADEAVAAAPSIDMPQSFMSPIAPEESQAEVEMPERRLEAVATPAQQSISRPRNGDEALRSALATLHRMNARSI